MKAPNYFIVVDDDPINNLVCKHIILRFDSNAGVELFTEPEKALAAIRKKYDTADTTLDTMLFLDINMPGMNGWEFLEDFETFPDTVHNCISVYILSSSIDPSDKDKAEKNALVKGYYSKPLSLETINQIIRQN